MNLEQKNQSHWHSKASEVYYRMAHPEWGVLPKYGFALTSDPDPENPLPDFMEVWANPDLPGIEVHVKFRAPLFNDPIAALVYRDDEKLNCAYNSKGLYDVLRYQLELEKVEA